MESVRYINGASNRYIEHMFLRLNRVVHDPKKFWAIAEQLLNKSNSFLTLSLHEVDDQWHKKDYGTI
jgi:hypothetical protein